MNNEHKQTAVNPHSAPVQSADIPTTRPEAKSEPDEMDQFVSAARLLQLLFPKDSRPSERWLRRMVVKGRIPAVQAGGRVWYHPIKVRESLMNYKKSAGRPKGSKNKPKPSGNLLGNVAEEVAGQSG
jgi:hypothetical protein